MVDAQILYGGAHKDEITLRRSLAQLAQLSAENVRAKAQN